MQANVPDFCFRVIGHPKIENGRCMSANGILVDRERGWFIVNHHFLDSSHTHTVLLPHIGEEKPLTLFRGLCEHDADIALMQVSDPAVLPESPRPLFRHISPKQKRIMLKIFLSGRMDYGNRTLSLHSLLYPAPPWAKQRGSTYEHSIMCSKPHEINLDGLSGSPLLDEDGNVLGMLTSGNKYIALFTPSFAIETIVRNAMHPTLGARIRKVRDLFFA